MIHSLFQNENIESSSPLAPQNDRERLIVILNASVTLDPIYPIAPNDHCQVSTVSPFPLRVGVKNLYFN